MSKARSSSSHLHSPPTWRMKSDIFSPPIDPHLADEVRDVSDVREEQHLVDQRRVDVCTGGQEN